MVRGDIPCCFLRLSLTAEPSNPTTPPAPRVPPPAPGTCFAAAQPGLCGSTLSLSRYARFGCLRSRVEATPLPQCHREGAAPAAGQGPLWGRGAQGTGRSQRRCEPLLLLLRRQRAPAVPEGKALFFLNRGSSPSEELRSVVPLPVWFKAGSGPAVILLVNFVKSLLEKSWQCTAAAGVEVACVEGGSYAREADGQNEAVCVSSTRFSDQRPGGGHRFPCTCHQFLNSYRFPS